METVSLELRKFGLKEKEASVYLASLELGYSSAQKIAQKAGVSRPTAYEIIKSLIKKGLMREEKHHGAIKGKKTYFTAESPDKLLGLLRLQKKEAEEKEREFIRIISALRSKYYLAGQSEIRTFEGEEGMKVLLSDFSQSRTLEIYFLTDNPNILKPWREKLAEIKKRLGELNVKEVKPKKAFTGALIIYDKLIYLPPKKSPVLLIENQEVVEMVKNLLKDFNV